MNDLYEQRKFHKNWKHSKTIFVFKNVAKKEKNEKHQMKIKVSSKNYHPVGTVMTVQLSEARQLEEFSSRQWRLEWVKSSCWHQEQQLMNSSQPLQTLRHQRSHCKFWGFKQRLQSLPHPTSIVAAALSYAWIGERLAWVCDWMEISLLYWQFCFLQFWWCSEYFVMVLVRCVLRCPISFWEC